MLFLLKALGMSGKNQDYAAGFDEQKA